jgi:hypothetical protein
LPRRELDKGVEEGLDILRDAIRDLLSKPKSEREEHIVRLKQYIHELLPDFEAVDPNSPSSKRLRALERVIATLEEVSERT